MPDLDEPVVCPDCGEPAIEMLRWPVTALMCWPHLDEQGRRHFHDLNNPATTYRCSNGHEFTPARCWCGWGAKVYDREAEAERRAEMLDRLATGLGLTDAERTIIATSAGRVEPVVYSADAFTVLHPAVDVEAVGNTDPVMLSGPAPDELADLFPELQCPALVRHEAHNWAPFPPPGTDRDPWHYCGGLP